MNLNVRFTKRCVDKRDVSASRFLMHFRVFLIIPGWDALSPDFRFRNIRFEDGVVLSAHEPHHHTA